MFRDPHKPSSGRCRTSRVIWILSLGALALRAVGPLAAVGALPSTYEAYESGELETELRDLLARAPHFEVLPNVRACLMESPLLEASSAQHWIDAHHWKESHSRGNSSADIRIALLEQSLDFQMAQSLGWDEPPPPEIHDTSAELVALFLPF